jgi:transposase
VNGQGREYCFTKNGDVLEDAQIQPTKKYGGGKVMVWSCITYEGVGLNCRIDGNLDGELYTDILRDELMKTIRYYQFDEGEVIFQQDNDPKHTSRVAKDALEDLNLNVMEWPSQSPDLNPIEHMWNHLKTELRSNSRIFATSDDLWDGIQEVMKNENKEMCRKLVSSMSSRVQAVINAKGGYTKY